MRRHDASTESGEKYCEDEPPSPTTIPLTIRSPRRINSAPINPPEGNAEFEKSAKRGETSARTRREVGGGASRETPGSFLREARVKRKGKRRKKEARREVSRVTQGRFDAPPTHRARQKGRAKRVSGKKRRVPFQPSGVAGELSARSTLLAKAGTEKRRREKGKKKKKERGGGSCSGSGNSPPRPFDPRAD